MAPLKRVAMLLAKVKAIRYGNTVWIVLPGAGRSDRESSPTSKPGLRAYRNRLSESSRMAASVSSVSHWLPVWRSTKVR